MWGSWSAYSALCCLCRVSDRVLLDFVHVWEPGIYHKRRSAQSLARLPGLGLPAALGPGCVKTF